MIDTLTKRTDELVNGLIDTQKRMWQAVSDGVQTVAGAPADKRWEKGIKVSEEMVHDSLKVQAELRKAMIERLAEIDAMPEAASESLERFDEMAEELTKNQDALISNCFEMLKTLDPTQAATAYAGTFNTSVDRLQKLARRAVEMQLEMVKGWTGQAQKASSSRKASSGSKTTSKKRTTTKKKSSSAS